MLILFLLKQSIDFLGNIKARYFEKDTLAYDEIVKDIRDYELMGNDETIFPEQFIYRPRRIFNQSKTGYRSSCTAQGTAGAADALRKSKSDKTFMSPFDLWDIVKEQGLGKEGVGAFLIDTIKVAMKNGFIDGYYRVLTHSAIKQALYNGSMIVTGSNKINWRTLQETGYIVKEPGVGSGHAFYISGWNQQGYVAYNSYGEQYGLKGTFIIPYDVFEKVAFNSTYAIAVDPEWASYTPEELYKIYLVNKKTS